MKKALSIFCMFLILSAPVVPPASADCCSDVLSCAATVATGGLSCVIQTLISTVTNLVTQVTNLRNSISSQLQTVAQGAQQALNTAAGQLGSEAQNVSAMNRQVITQAGQILNAELNPGATASTGTSGSGSVSGSGKDVGASGAKSGQSGSGSSPFHGATGGSPANTGSGASMGKGGAGPTAGLGGAGSTNGLSGSDSSIGAGTTKSGGSQSGAGRDTGTTSTNSSSGTTNSGGAGIAVSGDTIAKSNAITPGQMAANPTDILNAIKAAQQFVSAQQNGIDQQLQTVGHQVQLANQISLNDLQVGINLGNQAALAPLDTLKNYLQSLLANPSQIFDPTSMVDATMDTIVNNLSNTFDQVTNAVTKDASTALQMAQAPLTLMQQQLAADQAIEAAMDALHRERNRGALDALNNLLPHSNSQGGGSPAQATTSSSGGVAVNYTTVMSTFVATRQNVVARPKQQIQVLSASIAQLKSIRMQAKATVSAMPTYQSNFARQLDSYFAGKSSADAAKVRDQLIAQARARFASDPKTRDAVIQLLTGESNKRLQLIPMNRPQALRP
jgi:hypothetical protein